MTVASVDRYQKTDDANLVAPPAREEVLEIIRRSLREDVGAGDITSALTVLPKTRAVGRFVCRSAGIISGLGVAEMVFAELDSELDWQQLVPDAATAEPGRVIAVVSGRARPILTGERVSLNLLQRMSGVASLTARYVEEVRHTNAVILDTRKTAPGLRVLDKYAVRCGGGRNHRFGLFDGVLIKDNHVEAAGGIGAAVERAKREAPHALRVEAEVDRLDQIAEALDAGVDAILLDNMSPFQLAEAVRLIDKRALTEASGGVDLESVRAIAETGVDFISVGELTHSVRALDISLDLDLQ